MDDLGHLGAVWGEADTQATDLETVITDLLTGQYMDPVRVIAFNTVNAGRRTCRKTWHASCDVVATCRFATCRRASKTSSSAMRVMTGNWRCG
jgi:hypothetical protein